MENIIEVLREKKILDPQKAEVIASEVKSGAARAEELVLAQKIIDEDTLFSFKSEWLGIPLKKVDPEKIPLNVLEVIPEDSVVYYKMVPLSQEDRVLEMGMVYPENLDAKEALKFLARQGNFAYKISLISPSTFETVLKRYRNLKGEVTKALSELEQELTKEAEAPKEGSVAFRRLAEEAPVAKMVAVILRTAVDGNASDIHIEPAKDKVRVRFRLLGELHASLFLPLKVHQAIVAHVKILSNLRIDETRVPQDGRFSTPIDGVNIDFRVSTFPTALGEKVAIRVLDPRKGFKRLEDLGFTGPNLQKLKEVIRKPYGLILATGPTGSGKSTSLYAILQTLNREGVNIVSLEDPVEYLIEGVNQSHVRPEIGYDFVSGLRQILRQDPDVIMVGEVRDNGTATLVIHAALTGHIVLSTLHTNNAVGVIPRLLDMGIDKYLIPSTLAIAMSQRLIRRLCDKCKEKIEPAKTVQAIIEKEISTLPPDLKKDMELLVKGKEFSVYRAKGCKTCQNAGFSGRLAIFEVLVMTDELARIVLQEPSEPRIAAEAKRQGMTTLRQDGIIKALDGLTTIEEVLSATAGD